MSSDLIAIKSGALTAFRGNLFQYTFTPVDPAGNPITVPTGATGSLVVSHAVSTDSASQIVTYTDLYESGGVLIKDLSIAETQALPLGTFVYEVQSDLGTSPVQVLEQGQITIYPTILG